MLFVSKFNEFGCRFCFYMTTITSNNYATAYNVSLGMSDRKHRRCLIDSLRGGNRLCSPGDYHSFSILRSILLYTNQRPHMNFFGILLLFCWIGNFAWSVYYNYNKVLQKMYVYRVMIIMMIIKPLKIDNGAEIKIVITN